MFKKTMMVIIVALCMMSIVNVANADYFGYEDNGAQTLDYVNFDDGTIFTVNMTDGTLSYDSWGMGIYNTQVVSEGVIGVDPESKLCIFDNETSGTMTTLQFVDNGYGAYNVTTGFGETAIVEETFGIYFTYTANDVDYTIYSHNSLNDPEADWFEIYAWRRYFNYRNT